MCLKKKCFRHNQFKKNNHEELYQLRSSYNQLSASALNSVFQSLHNNNIDRKSINITGNPGTSNCKRSIAESKGWEVTWYYYKN